MSIWRQKPERAAIEAALKGTIAELVGIEVTEISDDSISARMPVDHRTIQPAGLLHGGASVVLAETLGSVASMYCAPSAAHRAVGIEVNANHLRGISAGFVTGTARPLHLGRSTHVWDIRMSNDQGQLVCISRLTVAVLGPT